MILMFHFSLINNKPYHQEKIKDDKNIKAKPKIRKKEHTYEK